MKKMAVVMPSLYVGGGELFTYYMLKNTDHERLDWHIVLIVGEYADKTLLKEYSLICPVWFNHQLYYRTQIIALSIEEALVMLKDCDGVVGWELDEERAHIFKQCPGIKYYLIFRHDIQHKKWTQPDYVLVANSESCIKDFGKIGNRHVHIVPSCFSKMHLQHSIPRDAMRNKLGVSDEQILVGFIGRMDHNKNPLALARVAAIDNDISVCAFGQRNWESIELEEDIKRISKGRMKWNDPVFPIGDILNTIDVFVQTSRSEVFSMALLEAWAFGVPTVSTRTGMVPYLNAQYSNICKVIYPDDTAQSIRNAIYAAVNDKEMVARAYDLANSMFTEEKFGKIWDSILLDCKRLI